MTVLERKTRFGGEETGVEVYRKSRKMPDFFADSPILITRTAKLTRRTIETQWNIGIMQHTACRSTPYEKKWETTHY